MHSAVRIHKPAEALHLALSAWAVPFTHSAWMKEGHPDEDGFHLRIFAPLLERFAAAYGEAAVFIDVSQAAPIRT